MTKDKFKTIVNHIKEIISGTEFEEKTYVVGGAMKYFVRILIVLVFLPCGLLWALLMLIITPINLIFLSWKFIVTGSSDKVFLEDDIFDKLDEYCDKLVGKIEKKLKKKDWL